MKLYFLKALMIALLRYLGAQETFKHLQVPNKSKYNNSLRHKMRLVHKAGIHYEIVFL